MSNELEKLDFQTAGPCHDCGYNIAHISMQTWNRNNEQLNLLVNNPEFILPKNAEERFKHLTAKNDPAKHFTPGRVNIFCQEKNFSSMVTFILGPYRSPMPWGLKLF